MCRLKELGRRLSGHAPPGVSRQPTGLRSRESRMSVEVRKALFWSLGTTVALAALVLAGSRNLAHFDAALVAYTFAVLFAAFGLTYRYSMWLQRPPTGLYWRRGWQAFLRPGWRLDNLRSWFGRVASDVLANRFIFLRDTANLFVLRNVRLNHRYAQS